MLNFGYFGFTFALFLFGCGSPDRVIDIPTAANEVSLSIKNITDYPEALVAIVPVMVHTLKLPAPQGRVFFYRDAGAYQSALTNEVKESLREFNKKHNVDSEALERSRNQTDFELFN